MKFLKDFFNKFSVKKLHDDLDYWIFINCGNDIVELKDQRQEYAHLVKEYEMVCMYWVGGKCAQVMKNDDIPNSVLHALAQELRLPWYKRPTFWHLVKLFAKNIFK